MLFITPASLNEIARAYHASTGTLAWLPLAVMAGFFCAVTWAGGYTDRHGKLPAIFAGCVFMTAGLVLFSATGTFGALVAASLLMGIGGGLSEGSAMALIADLYQAERRTSMANLSQASFGVGAVVCPLAIAWMIKSGIGFHVGYIGAAVLCAATAVLTYAALSMRQERPVGKREEGGGWRWMVRDPLVLALALGIMLYVGAEIGQSNWLSVYFRQNLRATKTLAAASLSLMWLGILVSRVVAAWASKYISEPNLIRICLAGAAASEAVLLHITAPSPGLAAAFSLGFFLAPVFPTIVSCAGGAYPERSGTVTSIVVAAGSMGGAIFPPAIGWAADSIGLRHALWTCSAILAIDLCMFLFLRVRRRVAC